MQRDDDDDKIRSLLIFVFIQQLLLLSTCYVPGTVLGSGDIAVNKTDKTPGLGELTSQGQPYAEQKRKIHSVSSRMLISAVKK